MVIPALECGITIGHQYVIAAAIALRSCWHVEFQWLEIGMSVNSVKNEYVVRCTSRVSWNNKSRDGDRFSDSFCFCVERYLVRYVRVSSSLLVSA